MTTSRFAGADRAAQSDSSLVNPTARHVLTSQTITQYLAMSNELEYMSISLRFLEGILGDAFFSSAPTQRPNIGYRPTVSSVNILRAPKSRVEPQDLT